MENPNIPNAILQKSVEFEISIGKPNLFHRLGILRTKRTFFVHPLNLGTLLEISRVLSSLNFPKPNDKDDLIKIGIETILKAENKLAQVIALAIINEKTETLFEKIKKQRLVRYIQNNITANEALKLMSIVVKQMDIQDFLALMVSIGGMNLMEAKSISGKSGEDSSITSESHEMNSSGDTVGKT